MKMKRLLRPRAGRPCWPWHGLCVFLCTLLWFTMRTLRSKLLLGKNVLNTYFTTVLKTVVKMVLNTYFTTVFKTVVKMVLDRQTLIFTVAIFFQYENEDCFSKNSNETRRIWAILAAPVAANSGKKICAFSYCSRGQSWKMYWIHISRLFWKQSWKWYWIAKPFVLPLQIFATITNKITFSQNSNETRRIWAILAAPVVANSGKKTCDSLMWIQKCIDLHLDRQTLCFTVANFQHVFILVKKIAKLEK